MAKSGGTLVAVQMAIHLDQFANMKAFENKIFSVFRTVRKQVPTKQPVLIAFPEDIGLGLLFMQDYEQVKNCKTIQEAGKVLLRIHGKDAVKMLTGGSLGPAMIHALLRVLSKDVEQAYSKAFAKAAKQFGWWVVAGSAPIEHQEKVYNTTYSFNPQGECVQVQRKVNLVSLEAEEGLNLCKASPESLGTIETPLGTIGVLVCYDAFFTALVERMVKIGTQILVQPSFNTPLWTDEERKQWEGGILHAVQKHPHLIGINPMMVGSLFDLSPTGQSSIVAHKDKTPQKDGYLVQAKTRDQEEILIYTLP
jgi:predicted amidohydrolase